VVIAGNKTAVEQGVAACKSAGAKRAMLLPVSVPAHSDLMRPAAEALRTKLQHLTINLPKLPVLHNVDVTAHLEIKQIEDALIRQLYSPVQWTNTLNTMYSEYGISLVAECGPGKVLTGLTKRINAEMTGFALTDVAALDNLCRQLMAE
jgi:[acyl-carrier-protein] S-malonyltransferase